MHDKLYVNTEMLSYCEKDGASVACVILPLKRAGWRLVSKGVQMKLTAEKHRVQDATSTTTQ